MMNKGEPYEMNRFCFALLFLALSGCSSPETVSPLPPLREEDPTPPEDYMCSPSRLLDIECYDTEQCVELYGTPCDAGTCWGGYCVP
jgi:hypothetical protein